MTPPFTRKLQKQRFMRPQYEKVDNFRLGSNSIKKSGIEVDNTCVHLSIATAPTVPEPLCHITAFDAVGSSQTFSKHVLRDHDSELVDSPDMIIIKMFSQL